MVGETKSVNLDHLGDKVTIKALDQWLADLVSHVKLLTDRIGALEKEHSAKDKIIANLRKEVEVLKEAPAAGNENSWSEVLKKGNKSVTRMNIVNAVSDENKERNKKEKNVIVFGLKESVKESIADKKVEDDEEVNKICEALSLQSDTVEGVFRLKTKDTTKPKPLVMVLKDKETRNKFLQAAKQLRTSNDYKTVYLCPDLTEAQRLKFRELVKIRDAKNEKLKDDEKEKKIWCIRDNEVVLLNKRK